ncbi:MAG: lamin tail domain-containing protein [Cyanophyceae cyanobacterium]
MAIYISEVYEGNGGSVKYVELYNSGSTAVDFSAGDYALRRYSNINGTGLVIDLTGTIGASDFYVIGNASTEVGGGGPFPNGTLDQTSGSINHNGNDKYELVTDASGTPTVIDSFAADNVGDNTDFAINAVAYRIASNLPNDGNWGSTVQPGDGADSASGNWRIFDVSAGNANALTVGTPGTNSGVEAVANLAIAPTDANKAEGDTGTTSFTFTVIRSGDTSGITDVNFAVTGTADAADFGGAVPSGTVNFAANASTETVTIQVSGDTDVEPNENFTVTLSGATGGATITTAAATGTIQNDDTGPTPTPTPTPTTPLPPPPTFVSTPTLGAIAGSITLDSTANTLVQETLTLSNTGSAPLQLQSLTPQFTAPLPNGIAPTEVLLLDPATGAIAPGETLTVQLTLRDDLLPGDYSGTLAIATNDLANPSVTVPFSGNVTLPKAMDVAPVYGAQLPSNTPIWTTEDDIIVGANIDGDGRQWLNGSSGDDLIFGNLDRDVLTGGPGNDSLFGGRGDDFLRGADGDDLLAGDHGDDTLQGNGGADGFVLAEGFGSDVILDFEDGRDHLVLAAPLTFESLTLQSQGNSTQILAGGEILATVIGVDNSLLTSADFSSF